MQFELLDMYVREIEAGNLTCRELLNDERMEYGIIATFSTHFMKRYLEQKNKTPEEEELLGIYTEMIQQPYLENFSQKKLSEFHRDMRLLCKPYQNDYSYPHPLWEFLKINPDSHQYILPALKSTLAMFQIQENTKFAEIKPSEVDVQLNLTRLGCSYDLVYNPELFDEDLSIPEDSDFEGYDHKIKLSEEFTAYSRFADYWEVFRMVDDKPTPLEGLTYQFGEDGNYQFILYPHIELSNLVAQQNPQYYKGIRYRISGNYIIDLPEFFPEERIHIPVTPEMALESFMKEHLGPGIEFETFIGNSLIFHYNQQNLKAEFKKDQGIWDIFLRSFQFTQHGEPTFSKMSETLDWYYLQKDTILLVEYESGDFRTGREHSYKFRIEHSKIDIVDEYHYNPLNQTLTPQRIPYPNSLRNFYSPVEDTWESILETIQKDQEDLKKSPERAVLYLNAEVASLKEQIAILLSENVGEPYVPKYVTKD